MELAFLRESKSLATKGVQTLISNFYKMPGVLRFLTGMSLLYLLFLLMSVVPGTINVHGRIVTTAEWWANGSGIILMLSSAPLVISGFLLLTQSRYSRPSYIAGWAIVDVAVVWIANINGASLSRADACVYGLLCIASVGVFATYLYLSTPVKQYLNDVPQERRAGSP